MATLSNDAGALKQLPLHDNHVAAGARMTEFAGWEMPVQYRGIVSEHEAVRTRSGLFDVSHMGRVWVLGPGAAAQIRTVSSYDTSQIGLGEAHYSLYCNESGGIEDDVFIYHVSPGRWLIVHNAANADGDAERLRRAAGSAAIRDVTRESVMLALQGPEAVKPVERLVAPACAALPPRTCMEVEWQGALLLVSRTGYTGEDGIEIITDIASGVALWDTFVRAGVDLAGLGARETLRLEAALPLHGHDIGPEISPYEARLGWAVSLDDAVPFTGRGSLERLATEKPERRLAHLRLLDPGIPREGCTVLDNNGRPVGIVTSGTFSPTLRVGIAMVYLPHALTTVGTRLAVKVRGRSLTAEVVRRPFYSRRKEE